MNWTTNGQDVRVQCGPFVSGIDGWSLTSAAKETNDSPHGRFRACGGDGGQPVQCTDW